MPRQTVTGQQQRAELLAVEALGFIAADAERLGRFLVLTGLEPATVRTAARDPAFLAAVLDHIVGDEALLLAFARDSGLDPGEIVRGCRILRGPDWERDTA
ncbi:MAG: DUF3572 domain-containing protein [Variibacter sp.]|nr:DUF3572 domain-containing protein [Variibacter sp.]